VKLDQAIKEKEKIIIGLTSLEHGHVGLLKSKLDQHSKLLSQIAEIRLAIKALASYKRTMQRKVNKWRLQLQNQK
jgi:hypothetical protein